MVYESLFGNTAAISETIAGSLRTHGIDAGARPVTRTPPETTDDIDLLIVGGPTHVHGMSRASTRKTGATDEKNTYAEPTVDPGLREWFEGLPAGDGRAAAAFDTRIGKPVWVTGSAAKGVAKRLERGGFRLMAEPESFLVTTANTLEDGEAEHAAMWAEGLAGRFVGTERDGR